jgi:probable rRNA maturation factor
VKLLIVGRTYDANRGVIERVAQAAFSYLPTKEGSVELKFVSKAFIQELNRRYRSIDAPTDVLSFNLSDDPLVGQIFICYTYTRKQAVAAMKTLDDEVALLVVHGILHVFGFDHMNKTEESTMQETERTILGREGITR